VNVKEYISSGILESYALGELTTDERTSVEQNLARYPELRAELSAIELMQEKLLMQAGIPPRKKLREKVIQRLEEKSPAKVVQLQSTESSFWKWAAAASIIVALVTTYLAFEYRSRWQKAEQLALLSREESQRIASQYNRVKNMEEELQIVADPDMKKVVLHGTTNAPEAMATVYWGESSEHVYIKVNKLKALEANNQYQLWAIINGKPVDAGVFNAKDEGMVKMKNIGKGATTFAVTIEPRGGNTSPSLGTMQVAGNV
jgi:anti-sigma-K factor RskA